jgi:hypothetical protein
MEFHGGSLVTQKPSVYPLLPPASTVVVLRDVPTKHMNKIPDGKYVNATMVGTSFQRSLYRSFLGSIPFYLEDTSMREQGVREDIINAWFRRNTGELESWAKSLPIGGTRDFALECFVENMASSGPRKAASAN